MFKKKAKPLQDRRLSKIWTEAKGCEEGGEGCQHRGVSDVRTVTGTGAVCRAAEQKQADASLSSDWLGSVQPAPPVVLLKEHRHSVSRKRLRETGCDDNSKL